MIKAIPVQDSRRAFKRQNFMIRATIGPESGASHAGRLRDLSAEGMKIELDAVPQPPMRRGDIVYAELRGVGRVKGEVVWRRTHWYGIHFARPIRPEQAIKPVGTGETTPDYVKPVLVPGRSLKYVEGL
ncbi:hypothetical protein GON01_07035 [Sphingomonas sp. MAH-20]|uniref:PilZ domain-containing protein n=1 Tax=Sphingomonas horti TaxID=2682842 RepID=A0A6I4IZK7_9SPHN|nr:MULTISPECIES: PilZ domain-containing protein [Sphingomonas]MBA2920753.1 PilZ domain-containing protein [Sphingomonas sp. CGMCC 1.13658]MVO77689.1 hypothetical protein [Sphingomonas horti]